MKVSIAMATYNGGQYLQEQLESFIKQIRLPDELVVCDDGSTDNTLEILFEFRKIAPFTVLIEKNMEKLGYSKNFGKALYLCNGDIIFFSDQDDVWLPDKIKRVEDEFLLHPETLLTINDTNIVLEDLTYTGLTKLEQFRSSGIGANKFIAGCCTAISEKLKALVNPIPETYLAYDDWIHRLAECFDGRRIIPDVLQLYRRHGQNTSNAIVNRIYRLTLSDSVRKYLKEDVGFWCERRLAVLAFMNERFSEQMLNCNVVEMDKLDYLLAFERIEHEKKSTHARIDLLKLSRRRRFNKVIVLWRNGGYNYFTGWKSLIRDLIC
jgi:glycosyltransferase involved in cell wall biosynthesis